MTNDVLAAYAARLREKLARKTRQEGECLIWTGTINNTGYGAIRINYKMHGVHRVAYQLAHGPIPEGYDVHHVCRNRCCINPDHLQALPRDRHNRRTHREDPDACDKGHPFDEENTYISPNGTRHCRTCRKLREAPLRRGPVERCPSGHAYDEENTYVYTDSRGYPHRLCRACRREKNHARQLARAKKRGGEGYPTREP